MQGPKANALGSTARIEMYVGSALDSYNSDFFVPIGLTSVKAVEPEISDTLERGYLAENQAVLATTKPNQPLYSIVYTTDDIEGKLEVVVSAYPMLPMSMRGEHGRPLPSVDANLIMRQTKERADIVKAIDVATKARRRQLKAKEKRAKAAKIAADIAAMTDLLKEDRAEDGAESRASSNSIATSQPIVESRVSSADETAPPAGPTDSKPEEAPPPIPDLPAPLTFPQLHSFWFLDPTGLQVRVEKAACILEEERLRAEQDATRMRSTARAFAAVATSPDPAASAEVATEGASASSSEEGDESSAAEPSSNPTLRNRKGKKKEKQKQKHQQQAASDAGEPSAPTPAPAVAAPAWPTKRKLTDRWNSPLPHHEYDGLPEEDTLTWTHRKEEATGQPLPAPKPAAAGQGATAKGDGTEQQSGAPPASRHAKAGPPLKHEDVSFSALLVPLPPALDELEQAEAGKGLRTVLAFWKKLGHDVACLRSAPQDYAMCTDGILALAFQPMAKQTLPCLTGPALLFHTPTMAPLEAAVKAVLPKCKVVKTITGDREGQLLCIQGPPVPSPASGKDAAAAPSAAADGDGDASSSSPSMRPGHLVIIASQRHSRRLLCVVYGCALFTFLLACGLSYMLASSPHARKVVSDFLHSWAAPLMPLLPSGTGSSSTGSRQGAHVPRPRAGKAAAEL